MGYTFVMQPGMPPLKARETHEELNDISFVDKLSLTLMDKNWFLLKYFKEHEFEKAKEYYKKAIELNPQYVDAYINLGSAMLEKDKELVEEMNKNLNDFDKYDQIKAEQVSLYKEVIPVYEKAYAINPDDVDTVRTLMSLYENTGMDDKFQDMKAKYDSMR